MNELKRIYSLTRASGDFIGSGMLDRWLTVVGLRAAMGMQNRLDISRAQFKPLGLGLRPDTLVLLTRNLLPLLLFNGLTTFYTGMWFSKALQGVSKAITTWV
jgi:hypothetical protein